MIDVKVIAAIIGVVVLITVGIVALDLIDEKESSRGWEFDDYKIIDGVADAGGSLELIDTHLGPTVHAHGVGDGTITFSDGTMQTVTVQRAILDVFLITGQSNSCYVDADPSLAEPVPAMGEAYAWMLEDGDYGDLTAKTGEAMRAMVDPATGESITGDKAPAFSSIYTSITGNKVYWICGGSSGKDISQFDPNGGYRWTAMKGIVSEAMEAVDESLFEVRTCAFMWIQGEADNDTPINTYKARFIDIVDAIINGELGYEFSHCFVSLVTERLGGNARVAQIEAAEEHPSRITIAADANSFTIDNGLMGSDNVHYSQLGDNVIGADLGVACGDYETNTTSSTNRALLDVMPILLILSVAIMCIGLALRALMGRD